MNIYFVRHGETIDNARHVHQSFESPLSKKGKKQSVMIAKFFRDKNIDYILTSDAKRAKETAEIISEEIGQPCVTSALFREVRRSRDIVGHSHFSVRSVIYVLSLFLHHKNSAWHYKDAENLTEVHVRIKEALKKLESLSGEYENVVVVSHAIFLDIMTSFLCREGEIKLYNYIPVFAPFSIIKNGSITHVKLHQVEATNVCKYEVCHVNETTHLKY